MIVVDIQYMQCIYYWQENFDVVEENECSFFRINSEIIQIFFYIDEGVGGFGILEVEIYRFLLICYKI